MGVVFLKMTRAQKIKLRLLDRTPNLEKTPNWKQRIHLFHLTMFLLTIMGLLDDGFRRVAHEKGNRECCNGKGRFLVGINLGQSLLSEMSFGHLITVPVFLEDTT